MKKFFLCIFVFVSLFSEQIETFYGPLEVQEEVLLSLISHPMFQRLKKIHQYGVSYYTKEHIEEYSRYDHSIGVFAILRMKDRPLKEQIAGLLHDVSHTAFSHVGDWIFGRENQERDYQNSIHVTFLQESGLGKVLQHYGYDPDEMDPSKERYPALEQPIPELCADRIDYNIQGAYFKGYISKEEGLQAVKSLDFIDGCWVTKDIDLWKKLVRSSLILTRHCWGGPSNHVASQILSDSIIEGCQKGIISLEEVHFGVDEEIWHKLTHSGEDTIRKKLLGLTHHRDLFRTVTEKEKAELWISS